MIIKTGKNRQPKSLFDTVKKDGTDNFKSITKKDFCSQFDFSFVGYKLEEFGLLFKGKIVSPHMDDFIVCVQHHGFDYSFFWVSFGHCYFKADGSPAILLAKNDWVIFRHDREHMAFSNKIFGGIAFQLY